MASKSPDAFRTISEVAEWLNTPAHVLRFWESKFSQVKPVKRAGGRRYYRPADMALIGGIKKLLHDDGMTIKGVQKLLREQGIKHVAAMSPPLDEELEQMIEPAPAPKPAARSEPRPDTGQVLSFAAKPAPEDAAGGDTVPLPETEKAPEPDLPDLFAGVEEDGDNLFSDDTDAEIVAEAPGQDDHIDAAEAIEEPATEPDSDTVTEDKEELSEQVAEQPPATAQDDGATDEPAPVDASALPAFLQKPLSGEPEASPVDEDTAPEPEATDAAPPAEDPDEVPAPAPEAMPEPEPVAKPEPEPVATPEDMSASEAHNEVEAEPTADAAPVEPESEAAEDADTPPAPAKPDIPADPADADIVAEHSVLTRLAAKPDLGAMDPAAIAPLVARLRALEQKMADASEN